MRLIAMGSHSRLQGKKSSLDFYKHETDRILHTILARSIPSQPETEQETGKELVIIIGSQKGLCGNFNTSLSYYFQQHRPEHTNFDIMTIGKQMKDTLHYQGIEPSLSYDRFTAQDRAALTDQISSHLMSPTYEAVIIYATRPKSFFVHVHERITFSKDQFAMTGLQADPSANSLFQEQSYSQTARSISFLALNAHLESILTDSLLAEASSRFLSMDAATRNAEDMINSMKLNYNKLRQASITKELTDLIGSFIS